MHPTKAKFKAKPKPNQTRSEPDPNPNRPKKPIERREWPEPTAHPANPILTTPYANDSNFLCPGPIQ
jgi:hypothetical protein